MKSTCLVVFLFLLNHLLIGQCDFSLTANAHYGFVIPHHTEVVNLIQGHSKGFEVSLDWKTDGTKPWHQEFHFPSVGMDFFVSNLGNNLQLGNQFSSMGFVNFPLNKKSSHFLKTGIGVGYASKIWELDHNPKDLFLSSHLNAAVLLQYTYRFLFKNKLFINTGLRITHLSNGSLKLPNKGINNATFFLGFSSNYQDEKVSHPASITAYKNLHFSTFFASGMKQMSISDPKKYLTFSFTNLLDKRISSKTSWGIGLDVFYNSGLKYYLIENQNVAISKEKIPQIGGFVSFTKHLFPWEIKIMSGAYLLDHYKKSGLIYNRFGLRYFLSEHLLAGLSLKTHFARADFAELGIGWRF